MSKYKIEDKVVLEITDKVEVTEEPWYILSDATSIFESHLDNAAEPLSTYTESLETKIENLKKKLKRWVEKCTNQSAEITRLLRENKELKNEKQELTRERNQLMGRCGGLSAAKIKAFNNGRLAGQNEAWELAKKIVDDVWNGGYSEEKLKQIFGYAISQLCIVKNTYSEAAAKVAEWEKAKEEIKVGDVLEDIADNNVKCVVTKPHSSNMAYLVFSDGSAGLNELDNLRKTGRHTDIDSFLKQIGEEE